MRRPFSTLPCITMTRALIRAQVGKGIMWWVLLLALLLNSVEFGKIAEHLKKQKRQGKSFDIYFSLS